MTAPNSPTQTTTGTVTKVTLPAPSAWPIVLAFGVTLLVAGLVTNISVTYLGAILFVYACVGWFRDVLPHEKEEIIEVTVPVREIVTTRHKVERLDVAPELTRAVLPLETYPVSAGIKGGLAGGVAMAVLACLYGLLNQHSIWYPINLLAATAYTQSIYFGTSSLMEFHAVSFFLALGIHLLTSLLVGLLYGAMLPMFPRRPILLGGVIAPILWTGLLYSLLGLLNPLLDKKIDWKWFIASQFAFGIVAGLVVVRQSRVRVRQFVPFLMRAGFEAPGLSEEKPERDGLR
ncbi:MAG TPA: hypothetical protein VGD60_16980 [Candidatus Acidoferrales bacterium]